MYIRAAHVGALLLAILVLAACTKVSVLGTAAPRTTVAIGESYVLGPGDELNIVVYNNEDLSDNFVVGEGGMISLPLVGQIRAAGRTTEAVGQEFSDLLADGYLVNPRVSVNISKYRSFYIIGGVNNPGAYPYQSGMTILHAIALAGGHSELAIRNIQPLLQRASGAPASGEVISIFTQVFPGDIVEIPENASKK